MKQKVVVILGPTSSGKSDLAVKIARRLCSGQASKMFRINGAEVISADSRQVYKKLNIGTGKITKKEMRGIKHHLLNVVSPKKTFTVAEYQKLATGSLRKILNQGKLPIICGGTGLYIDALIYDYPLPDVKPNPKLRKKLERLNAGELFNELKKLDPRRAKSIDPYNRRRLIRALEIVTTKNEKTPPPPPKISKYDVLFLGINKHGNKLKKLIETRLIKRINSGMIKEVKILREKYGLSSKRLNDLGLEYRQVGRFLRNEITKEELLDNLRRENFKYAKRQMTWFKKNKEIKWIKTEKEALGLIKQFIIKPRS